MQLLNCAIRREDSDSLSFFIIIIFKCHINFVELKSCFTLSFLNVSLTGDLIRLQTCVCRPLLLIHLYAALLITKSQAFGSIVFIVSLYCMEVCTCEVHVYFFINFFCGCKKAAFPLVVNESFVTTGAAYVMCLCLRLKCKSVHRLTACSLPTLHCEAQHSR